MAAPTICIVGASIARPPNVGDDDHKPKTIKREQPLLFPFILYLSGMGSLYSRTFLAFSRNFWHSSKPSPTISMVRS